MKKNILIFTSYFLPGVKGGGPIKSIYNIVDSLKNEYNFYIVTSDRDLGDSNPYKNVLLNDWNKIHDANVFYINNKDLNIKKIKEIIKSINFDLIYLQSAFNFRFSLIPLFLSFLNFKKKLPIILAPRGEFSPGALQIKEKKKSFFIKLSNLSGLFKDILWHATNIEEKQYINNLFGEKSKIIIANNISQRSDSSYKNNSRSKEKGDLKIVFISRISRKKNLDFAINTLSEITGEITFNIFGPIEDEAYWAECQELIAKLGKNIKVKYKGILDNKDVCKEISNHHLFYFPTKGENFGHVISEAIMAYTPILISKDTPWKDLESKGVGYDISLEKNWEFVEKLQTYVEMDDKCYQEIILNIEKYIKEVINTEKEINDTRHLFKYALEYYHNN